MSNNPNQVKSEIRIRTGAERSGLIIAGLILIGLGFIFLLGSLHIVDWAILWPGILIVVGMALLIGAALKSRPRDLSQQPQQ